MNLCIVIDQVNLLQLSRTAHPGSNSLLECMYSNNNNESPRFNLISPPALQTTCMKSSPGFKFWDLNLIRLLIGETVDLLMGGKPVGGTWCPGVIQSLQVA